MSAYDGDGSAEADLIPYYKFNTDFWSHPKKLDLIVDIAA